MEGNEVHTQGEEPESLLPCQQPTAEPGVFYCCEFLVDPRAVGDGYHKLLDAVLPELVTNCTLWAHTRMRLVYPAEPHVYCSPAALSSWLVPGT